MADRAGAGRGSCGGRGHVFAVHGRIELLRHDAVVVPTGPRLQASRTWWPLLGRHDHRRPRSGRAAPGVRYGRGTDTVWLLDVERPPGAGLPWLLDGVREVLEEIAAVVRCDPRRVLPLVCLDALAAQAGTDASWVLDERFEALLEEGDTDTARRIRALGRKIEDREPWRGLRAALARHGLT